MTNIAKYCIITIILAIISHGYAQAQLLGVKASHTFNTIFVPDTTTSENVDVETPTQSGFNAGFFTEYKVSDKMSAVLEILFALQGRTDITTIRKNDIIAKKTINIQTTYNLNVPLFLRFYPSKKLQGLALEIGPQFSFCLGGKLEHKVQNFDDNGSESSADTHFFTFSEISEQKQEENNNEDFRYNNIFTLSATTGIGYFFKKGFFFDARYTIGLTNAFNMISKNNKIESVVSKNSVISLSIGYKF